MKKKALGALASLVVTLLMFSLPILAVGAIVAVPVQAVSDFFNGIQEFVFGDGSSSADELVMLIQMTTSNKENQTKIKETYSGKLTKNGVTVPEHWVVVVQLLSGIEFEAMTSDEIERIVDSALVGTYNKETKETTYELAEIEVFTNNIKKISPYNAKLEKISSSVLAELITKVGSIDSGSNLPQEIIDKYKGKLLYPFSSYYPVGDSVGTYYPNGKPETHNGLDIKAPCGTPVYAMDNGIVTTVEANNHWRGNYIIWTNGDMEFRYLHFRDPLTLRPGEMVSKGQYIGSVGNTGYSFGCHLHLEVHLNGEVIDPLTVLEVRKGNDS